MKMKKLSEYLFMGALGGTLYYMIEIIFRGYSHWSMFLLGGICFIFFAQQGLWTKWREPLWKQVLWCTAFVVSAEFITGYTVTDAINSYRIEKAKEILETGEYRVCEVGEMVGIEDPAYFTHVFLKYEGKSPSDFMNR